jgi:DNA modification methylase
VIVEADNLRWLVEQMGDNHVDLVYLDPPFFTGRDHVTSGAGFSDRWATVDAYVAWLEPRVVELRRVMKPTASLYLHCDHHASHHIRLMLDRVFSPARFRNEIVWYYRGGGVSPRQWARRHDSILFYTKGSRWTFNVDPVRTPYSESVTSSPSSRYDKSYRGDRVYAGYRPNPLGKHPDDVWPLQPIMASDKTERLGYPTQKPELLLERIILASSNPGDLVLDPCVGSGTTCAVAHRLGRRYIGVDVSPEAASVATRRLAALGEKGTPS